MNKQYFVSKGLYKGILTFSFWSDRSLFFCPKWLKFLWEFEELKLFFKAKFALVIWNVRVVPHVRWLKNFEVDKYHSSVLKRSFV